MQRRYRALEKLQSLVAAGSLSASDASHRAVQIVESTPQPVRLQEPRLAELSKALLAQAANDSAKAAQVAILQGRLDRLRDEDVRVQSQLQELDIEDPTTLKAAALRDVVEFSHVYALLEEYKYLDAFAQLAHITPSTWQRTPHTTQQQLLKSATTVMGHGAVPAQDKMASASSSIMHANFLAYIRTLHDAKVLPPNWIVLPSSISAMKLASLLAKDATCLLHLLKAQNNAYAESLTISYALAQRDLTEPQVVAPSPALLIAAIETLDYLNLHGSIPLVHQAYRGPPSSEILDCLLRVLVQPRLSRKMARTLSVSITLDLVPIVEHGCSAALLQALVTSGLVHDAYGCYLKLHKLSPGARVPTSILTDMLVAFYKAKQYDQFHLAFDEMWRRGYVVGLHEFRALSAVVPPHVLLSLMGSRDYSNCLAEVHTQASATDPMLLDLRTLPASLAPSLLWLHVEHLRPHGLHDDAKDGLRVLVQQPQAIAALQASLEQHNVPWTSPRRGELCLAAASVLDYLERQDTQRVKDSVWRMMVLRALGVSSLFVS
ncbi:hypothetical protein SPRG_04110 [Saprolegnia parasitica CBS 223.65]|uniref:Uncharacterized protein n=1 Tax=Saprolegnia parasitica (strain CBS 223.65) TaxID=695850 RepID=A0A067CY76_SAPPC|nr:hypothetical protein SPRG_04110 [Saprolegnia parasitica CBS 223.65]KDO31496.1 hypothetical protein SPRG_04110 [Saprolegnia parasitica CBS 223.65]|eukprot:XP_012198085.1 hypothetical protein SPRG_04110 [Saprolegnia parasitica CBS 223.65]